MKTLLAICIVCIISITVLLQKEVTRNKKIQQKYEIAITNQNTLQMMLHRNMKAILKSNSSPIKKEAYLYQLTKSSKDSIKLVKIRERVVLFVPAQSCNVCYDEIYDALLYARDSLNYDIPIITGKEKYNEVRNMIRDLGFSTGVYYLTDNEYWDNISIKYAPFLAIIDSNQQISNCFIPLPNYPMYSYEYLTTIQTSKKH